MYNPVSGSFDQEIIWCISDESQSYTCTLSPIVGEDCQTQKATRPRVGAGSR
jgi:methylamine dehydrogenase light chain